jgi:hypothetical protein
MDAIQPKFPMKNEFRSQLSSSHPYYTIVIRLKTLETCYFDIPNLDEAIKLVQSLDALITFTGKGIIREQRLDIMCFPAWKPRPSLEIVFALWESAMSSTVILIK